MADDVEKIAMIYMQWSDDGQHIRKWSREHFDGGEPMYSRSFLLSEERVEAAAKMMWLSETVGGPWEDLGEWEKDSYRTSARAALTAAIGEGK